MGTLTNCSTSSLHIPILLTLVHTIDVVSSDARHALAAGYVAYEDAAEAQPP
jgi:hypothetical protein